MNLSSNVVGDSNGETNISHKLLLTNTLVSKICKAFTNGSSGNIEWSKTQLFEMVQLEAFLPFFTIFSNSKNLIDSITKLFA